MLVIAFILSSKPIFNKLPSVRLFHSVSLLEILDLASKRLGRIPRGFVSPRNSLGMAGET